MTARVIFIKSFIKESFNTERYCMACVFDFCRRSQRE
jgi:hypothetical protein